MDWTDASKPTQRDCIASVLQDKKVPRFGNVSVSWPIEHENGSVVARQSARCPRKEAPKISSTLASYGHVVFVRGFRRRDMTSAGAF